MRNTIPIRAALFGSGETVSSASAIDSSSCSTATVIRRSRRSTTSARAPPMSEKTSNGPSWAKTMSPTKLAEPVSSKA